MTTVLEGMKTGSGAPLLDIYANFDVVIVSYLNSNWIWFQIWIC